ncbi:TetR/AcrR family transcriptional regulator [Cohnella rhizosphaerae]|uniref:TetR/AcrR family transcriptional regulator n=1 Tax=Cohnella rhizosphaerae TaxID=1457232 RepID=A0A9X4KW67_9BACL|nr:TetR/AcrR family transcriptional regulator [Cohnella rhizosphaerae]MDG0812072.1 TetR/AcrR family transcriptional regulator [Cohnella rhizosphaerae]
MEFGYEPVSLNQIAERAGVTKASIYYYFSGKSELFAASVTEMMGRIRGFTRQILEQEGTLRERLIRVATVKMASTHVEFESMMREAIASLNEEQRRDIREAEHRIHEVLAECFADAAARGEMRGGEEPLLLAHAFSSLLMVGGARHRRRAKGRPARTDRRSFFGRGPDRELDIERELDIDRRQPL